MELCHDNFCRRDAKLFVHTDGNATAIVSNRKRMIGMQYNVDFFCMACKMLVDRVIDNFPDAMVQGRTIVWISEVHSRSLPDSFKPFENLDACCIIIISHIIIKSS